MNISEFISQIQKSFPNQTNISADLSLSAMSFDSLNITELMLTCANIFPQFDYNENFIFFKFNRTKMKIDKEQIRFK